MCLVKDKYYFWIESKTIRPVPEYPINICPFYKIEKLKTKLAIIFFSMLTSSNNDDTAISDILNKNSYEASNWNKLIG